MTVCEMLAEIDAVLRAEALDEACRILREYEVDVEQYGNSEEKSRYYAQWKLFMRKRSLVCA